jgi:DNA-binding transcriptional ArsR family regulator
MKRTRKQAAEQTAWDVVEQLAPTEPEFRIADLDTLRVVADPTRIRILELLVLEPQTVKRLAATLELPQTKLYYHINLLEERGLVRVMATRVVSGIIEKQYGAVAQSYRVDEALLALSGRDTNSIELMLTTLLDGVKNDIRQGLRTGSIELGDAVAQERRVTIGRAPLRLTPEQAATLHQRIDELLKEFCPDPDALGRAAPGTQLYSLFFAYFPTYVADGRLSPTSRARANTGATSRAARLKATEP